MIFTDLDHEMKNKLVIMLKDQLSKVLTQINEDVETSETE